MGDFNIDLLKSETSQISHDFLMSLQSCYLIPTVDKPTRVHRNSATLIDNIFLNNPDQILLSVLYGYTWTRNSPIYRHWHILPVSFMYYKTMASLMHDISSNNSPTILFNLFEKTSTIHSYHTRSSTPCLVLCKTLKWDTLSY